MNQPNQPNTPDHIPENWVREFDTEAHDDKMRAWHLDPMRVDQLLSARGDPPVDVNEAKAWEENLPTEAWTDLQKAKVAHGEERQAKASLHNKLLGQVPDLYQGRLPADVERTLFGVSNGRPVPYAIGIYTTYGTSEVSGATDYLQRNRGIEIGQAQVQRPFSEFRMYDRTATPSLGEDNSSGVAAAIEGGLTYAQSQHGGRFVTAFPDVSGEQAVIGRVGDDVQFDTSRLPRDALVTSRDAQGNEITTYNTKYTAFFIDSHGQVWKNENFGRSAEPSFVRHEKDDAPAAHVGPLAVAADLSRPIQAEVIKPEDMQFAVNQLEKGLASHNGENTLRDQRLRDLLQAAKLGEPNTIEDILAIRENIRSIRERFKILRNTPPAHVAGLVHGDYDKKIKEIAAIAKSENRKFTAEEKRLIVQATIYADLHNLTPTFDTSTMGLQKVGTRRIQKHQNGQ